MEERMLEKNTGLFQCNRHFGENVFNDSVMRGASSEKGLQEVEGSH